MISLYNQLRLKGKVELTSQIDTDFPTIMEMEGLARENLLVYPSIFTITQMPQWPIQVLGNDWDHVHWDSNDSDSEKLVITLKIISPY